MARTAEQESARYIRNKGDRAAIVLEAKNLAGNCEANGRRCLDRITNVWQYPELYQFDHVRGPKKFEIGAWVVRRGKAGLRGSYGIEALAAELEKCELVCVICHYGRTRERHHRG